MNILLGNTKTNQLLRYYLRRKPFGLIKANNAFAVNNMRGKQSIIINYLHWAFLNKEIDTLMKST